VVQTAVAVLPFTNLSGDPEQDLFADGLVEDLITTLSKISGLIVIARASTVTYKGRGIDLRQVGQELRAGHMLTGSVRNSEGRVRVSAQLIEAQTGVHLLGRKLRPHAARHLRAAGRDRSECGH
jgi:TolB-like protein